MSSKRARSGLFAVFLAVISMTFVGGCTHADSAVLEMFVADLLRNVAAALLL